MVGFEKAPEAVKQLSGKRSNLIQVSELAQLNPWLLYISQKVKMKKESNAG